MRKLILTILASCAALGLSCAPQTDANRNANVTANVNATPAVNASPAVTNSNSGVSKGSEEEETVTITLEDVGPMPSPTGPPPSPTPLPCKISVAPEKTELIWNVPSQKTKVEWLVDNKCKGATEPITVEIMFKAETGGAFGEELCDNRFLIDFVKEGKSKRVVSRSAISDNGTYKYGVIAYLSVRKGKGPKVAVDIDPQIEISGQTFAR
jgi:hypothetical protein